MKSMFKIIISLFTVMFICSSNIFAADYFARVILVGDAASGKTSLWRRLFGEKFDMSQNASDMMVRRDIIKNIDGKEVQFNIWDTAGAESYYDEVVSFTKGANFVIIVHDIDTIFNSDREQYLTRLYGDIHSRIKDDGKIMIVGNKWDLRHYDIVNSSKHKSLLQNVAQSIPCALKLVSCKRDTGDIDDILDYFCSASKNMELYRYNPDTALHQRFKAKKGGTCPLF